MIDDTSRAELAQLPGGLSNEVKIVGQFAIVKLTRGKSTLIDVGDIPRLVGNRWHAARAHSGHNWYAAATSRAPKVDQKRIPLHRLLMGDPVGLDIDHKNGNGLDNRRSSNLRPCTPSQNQANRKHRTTNTSGYRGVSLLKATGKWQAIIQHNYRFHYLGVYPTKEEAAMAYDRKARELFGDFAVLNFPELEAA